MRPPQCLCLKAETVLLFYAHWQICESHIQPCCTPGFDLTAFNRFRKANLTDLIRIIDIKHTLLSKPCKLQTLEVTFPHSLYSFRPLSISRLCSVICFQVSEATGYEALAQVPQATVIATSSGEPCMTSYLGLDGQAHLCSKCLPRVQEFAML